ncbi:MAG: MotA/TolQ/ExbB proton channel family protein [Planctomycetaceae bacterium]|nr:MotA/TolQ/ExbB proton channel family protein [Planctomycetaceae bacterium]
MTVRTRAHRMWQIALSMVLLLGMSLEGMQSFALADDAAPPAEPPAAAPPAAPAEAPATTDGGGESEGEQSFLMWMAEASGAWGVILLLLSFVMVAVIMMNLMQVRRETMLPPEFVAAFEEKLNAKDVQGAFDIARGDESLVARVLAAGMARLGRGYEEAVEGMQEVGEEESMAMEHKLSWLALIGSVAPMIGLMGTVWGMIASFRIIATSATQPKPKDLADGISTALFTTLEGLVVAIPAIVAYGLLRNRVSRLLLEVGRVSEGLMSRFNAGKKA